MLKRERGCIPVAYKRLTPACSGRLVPPLKPSTVSFHLQR